jgi:hypothetical protein
MKTVWVVIESDRGMGESVLGVYISKDKAFKLAAESSHYYVTESELDEDE